MKFGIITLVSENYGNKYQNYAVEQLLSEYGEVETFELEKLYDVPQVARKSKFLKLNPSYIKEVLISRPMYQYDITCVDKGIFHNLIYAKKHSTELLALRKKRSERFRSFTKANLHISNKVLNRENITGDWIDGIDFFICGSDQIWNPYYATTSELAFCSFAPEKTICLSPSFGVSLIPDYRYEEFSRYISSIKTLSIREDVGQKLIKKLTGRNAEVLLDPTMALTLEKWNDLLKCPKTKLPKHYIACYFLGRIDKAYRKQINKFTQKVDLPVVRLFDIIAAEYYILDPAEVLYIIKNADYVLTDSFHGSVFSILFHKNFFVFGRNEGGESMSSRLDTLLEKFELTDRIYKKTTNPIIPVNKWNLVEDTLFIERKKIIKYLNLAITN